MFLFYQLDERCLCGVAAAHTGADNAGVAAIALRIAGSDFLKQLLAHK